MGILGKSYLAADGEHARQARTVAVLHINFLLLAFF
jgi:hypothetical protein